MLKFVKNIPAGNMLVPLLLAAMIRTFMPWTSQIGSPFTALFSSEGTMTIVALMLVFLGIQMKPNEVVPAIKSGGVLITLRLLLSFGFGYLVMSFFGLSGFWGLSTLALVACITSCNASMYVALATDYGTKIDQDMSILVNIIGLPFVAVAVFGISSGQGIDYLSILGTVIPFFLGMLLGVLAPALRDKTKNGVALLIPFMGYCLGSNINLLLAFSAFGKGLLLYSIFFVVNTIPMYLCERFVLKQSGIAANAMCICAGLSLAVPQIMADIHPEYAPYVQDAIPQLAFTVIVSCIVVPYLVAKIHRKQASLLN